MWNAGVTKIRYRMGIKGREVGDKFGRTLSKQTQFNRVFSGRARRSIAPSYVRAANATHAPALAPNPTQRRLTSRMRAGIGRQNDVERTRSWASQSAALASAKELASKMTRRIWADAQQLLAG